MGKKQGQRKRPIGNQSEPRQKIYRDAMTAWESFRRIGGLDLADRDADLEKELLIRLGQPQALTLDDALRRATTDDLVRALFAAISPFVEMFRDTLDFFKAASARVGRQQWEISIDDEHLDLKEFEQFFASVSEIKGKLEVPDFDPEDAFNLLRCFPDLPTDKGLFAESPTGDPEADRWLADYRQGAFPDLPDSLRSKKLTGGLEDFRRVLMARLSILRAAFGDRAILKASYDWTQSIPDAYHPMTVGQQESDYWAGSAFTHLHHFARFGSIETDHADAQLVAMLAGQRRFLDYTASIKQLERILSLPVWRKRHELYAVWIATVIVGALPDHEVELHQEEGRILFAFKETEVARVVTSSPERRLIAERRTQLANPVGHGRVGAVQPDFGIWIKTQTGDTCRLVVEVKHYKREKTSAFKDVLADYARAHPDAQVALVNHGPLSYLANEIADRRLADRCHTIGTLTSRNKLARESLARLVRAAVGAPIRRRPGSASFLVDVSGSMDRLLRKEVLQVAAVYAARAGVTEVALVDVAVVATVDLEALPTLDITKYGGGGTQLEPTANELVRLTDFLIALTDSEGLEELKSAGLRVDIIEQFGAAMLVEARAG